MIVIHDDEEKVGELLHSTPLTTREYVWGKWIAVLASFFVVLALQLGSTPSATTCSRRGAERVRRARSCVSNYVWPALIFCVPCIVLVAGVSFALGTWTRKPIPVFFFPAALLLRVLFFLWSWEPSWLLRTIPASIADRLARSDRLPLAQHTGCRSTARRLLQHAVGSGRHGLRVSRLPGSRRVARGALAERSFARRIRGTRARRRRGARPRATSSVHAPSTRAARRARR
jgi:hypothetical protein